MSIFSGILIHSHLGVRLVGVFGIIISERAIEEIDTGVALIQQT